MTSVWDLIPDDKELYSNVFQEHFANTDLQVIAIFKVCPKARVPSKAQRLYVCACSADVLQAGTRVLWRATTALRAIGASHEPAAHR